MDDNATWLFLKAKELYSFSEDKWTDLFVKCLFEWSNSAEELSFPTYRYYCYSDKKWEIKEAGRFFVSKGLDSKDVRLNQQIGATTFFPMIPITPAEYWHRPDIIIMSGNNIHIIEVKTIGDRKLHEKKKYIEFLNFLIDSKCNLNPKLYFLISQGHEDTSSGKEWKFLADNIETPNQFELILWEDVLRKMTATEPASSFLRQFENIHKYLILSLKGDNYCLPIDVL